MFDGKYQITIWIEPHICHNMNESPDVPSIAAKRRLLAELTSGKLSHLKLEFYNEQQGPGDKWRYSNKLRFFNMNEGISDPKRNRKIWRYLSFFRHIRLNAEDRRKCTLEIIIFSPLFL